MWQRIIHFVSYLLLFLALILLTVFYRQPFFVFACLLLVFLPFASYLMARYCFHQLDVSIASQPGRSIKNSELPLILTISNPTLFPLLRAEVTLHISSPFYPNLQEEKVIIPVLAKNMNEHRFMVSYERIGCYQLCVQQLIAYDYLHFFSFTRKLSKQFEVKILPSVQGEIEFHDSFYAEGFDEFEEISQNGFATADIADVREYIPGDKLQKIHWKLTSKIDKLMVKEAQSGATHSFIVLPELYLDKEKENCDYLDCSLENAFLVCSELLIKGEPFFLSFYSILKEDFISFRPQTKEDVESAFEQVFYEEPYETPDLAYRIYQASEISKGTIIHVTHEGVEDEDKEIS